MSVETNLAERIGSFPFVTLGRKSQNWKGVEAFIYKLAVPDEFPIQKEVVYWPRITLVMHLEGEPNQLDVGEGKRWQRHVSQPGGIHFSAMNAPKRMHWTKPCTNLSLSLDYALISTIAHEVTSGDPTRLVNALGHHRYFRDALLAQMGYMVAKLLTDESEGARLYGESLAVSIAHHLLYHYTDKPMVPLVPREMTNSNLQRALDYIHAHYDQDFSLGDLAEATGFSIAHFSRLFRQATGQPPYQYLIQLRCEKACALLQSGRYTVTQVAQMVGFFDHSHFLRHFNRIFGVTPHQWLMQHDTPRPSTTRTPPSARPS
ncbi:MAG: AraC family transcriptional regulator [Chloroflexota bacterium]|nr:AraC family transcriptional regulator [Chloroflexota bacterium]